MADAVGRPKLTFWGAAGTVTGSKYLFETGTHRFLVDCGLFQGHRAVKERNWAPPPFDPRTVDAVILTHAHLDHSGYLPLLIDKGFAGPVISTGATRNLCGILLPDSGFLMEKDAEYANRKGYSKHKPALPLYTQAEAETALERFTPIDFGQTHDLGDGITVRLIPSGHILGSAFVELTFGETRLVFSGDLGRPGAATMVDPTLIEATDYLVIESTYGNRLHEQADPETVLAEIIIRTVGRGGSVVIPSFAVGRSQSLLYHIARLKQKDAIPNVPVFLDSPMAINASEIFCRHLGEHRLSAEECHATCNVATYTRSVEASKSIDEGPMPRIVLSASGMCTGGRILHHLKRFAPDRRSTIVLAGFQAAGTRGAQIAHGAKTLKIHGETVPLRAEVREMSMLSAHADRDEILGWLKGFATRPKVTFVTHGEADASTALAERIGSDLEWSCTVPRHGESAMLE